MKTLFEAEVETALTVLQSGGVILYPTDTIWGLGCDAANEKAIQNIYDVKGRSKNKSVIILLADSRDLLHYVAAPHPAVFDYIEKQDRPTTIIFENALGLSEKIIAPDGSVAIRIVADSFCRHLIKRLRKPLVSTSANSSGAPSPRCFSDIPDSLKKKADYVVKWRQDETTPAQASQIVRWNMDGTVTVLRP